MSKKKELNPVFNEKLDQHEDNQVEDPQGLHSHSKPDDTAPLEAGLEEEDTDAPSTESFENTQEERDLVRKLDRRILPITCLLYLFASLDRSNIGNARLQGLPEDILDGDASGQLFDWVTSAFFFSYVLFQIPLTILSKLFPPKAYVALAAIGWGTTSTLLATAFNFPSLFVGRLVLGVFEAGFGPVITLYFSFFYTKQELGLRFALWFGFATVAGAFGGLIAFGVQHISWDTNHDSISHNWRLLFIIEGIPPVLLGIVTYFFLPNRPESTTYLTDRERKIAVERMNRDSSGDVGATVNKAHVIAAFTDWRIYVGGIVYFGLNCALASIGAFLPTVITTFGYTKASAQLMTVPPYVVSAIVMLAFSVASDKLQSRGFLMAFASLIGAIGYLILLVVPHDNHVRYFSTFCITSGTYTTIGLTIAWFGHNLGSETKKATGIPIFMAIGQCGSILGSHLFPKTDGPRYLKGFGVSCALMFLAAACCVVLSMSYRFDNARRDKQYGKPKPNARVVTHDLADKAPDFRYVP
ncbi:major facilitator superfamily domain-containing protein [Crepidotus variabilis]|uniref:Major facilitator superfamily domain-containing protein n=1 Tax=Crepidotus variabilis TaxID=179855 RepID=A0A9P6EID3_9AGAR|nr:major facilitator superfamily domain-containing protein [Crepidotus variabilis]